MVDPFAFLGLDRAADERAIKRAYALRLRGARPESDPAGFQALNEAYRFALALARERDEDDAEAFVAVASPALAAPAGFEPAPAPAPPVAPAAAPAQPAVQIAWAVDGPAAGRLPAPPAADDAHALAWDEAAADVGAAPARPDERERLDFAAFFDGLREHAARGDADALRAWLQRQPALWSLTVKAQAGQATMAALHALAPPMPERCFDAVLAFFDMDHVLAGQDPLRLDRLRRRLHVEWLLQDRHELAASLQAAQVPLEVGAERLFALLSGPFRWPVVLLQALPPRRPSEVAAFLRYLQQARVERLPAGFDRRRIAFWQRAGDRSAVTLPRVAVGLARCAALLLLATALDGLRAATGSLTTPVAAVVLLGCALWALYVGWTAVSRWQGLPQDAIAPTAAFWTRLLFIPALCLAACIVRYAPPPAPDGGPVTAALAGSIALAVFAIVLALVRYRRRAGSGPWFAGAGYWRWLVPIFALRGLAALGVLFVHCVAAGAAAAVAIWLADLLKQRVHLRR